MLKLLLRVLNVISVLLITNAFEFPFTVIDRFITSNICIGTPKQCFCVLMDTGSPFLWVPHAVFAKREKLTFDDKQSSTFKESKAVVAYHRESRKVKGNEVSDIVTIHAHELEASAQVRWALVVDMENFRSQFDGIFGFMRDQSFFARGSHDISYNYLEALHKKNVIEQRTLGFKFNTASKGMITMGNPVPNKGFSKCSSTGMQKEDRFKAYWYCAIDSIMYSNSSLEIPIRNPQYALFVTGERKLFAPNAQGMRLFKEYERMSNGFCYINALDEIEYFTCKKSIDFNVLESIEITLGSVVLQVKPKDIFKLMEDYYICLIKLIPFDNIWVIGEPVLKNYHTIYDYDNDLISFALNDADSLFNPNKQRVNTNSTTATSYFLMVILFILGALIGGLVVFVIIKKIRLKWFYNKRSNRPLIDFSTEMVNENANLGINIH